MFQDYILLQENAILRLALGTQQLEIQKRPAVLSVLSTDGGKQRQTADLKTTRHNMQNVR
jgi:hypothetical protein